VPGTEASGERDRNNVRLFLSTYTYIDYGRHSWWQQVLYAMPINRLAPDQDEQWPI